MMDWKFCKRCVNFYLEHPYSLASGTIEAFRTGRFSDKRRKLSYPSGVKMIFEVVRVCGE